MKSYWFKCGKYTKNIKPRVSGTSSGETMIFSECAICGNKNQEANGLLCDLGLRTSFSKESILGDIFLKRSSIEYIKNK